MRQLVAALLLTLVVACGGSTRTEGAIDGSGGHGGLAGAGGTAGTTGCSGSAPMCADGCGSDWFPETAFCHQNAWKCPGQTVLPSDCPPGTCWGLPLPGESCGPGGWQCTPTPEDVNGCPSLMCATCNGFDGPMVSESCECKCEGGQVTCAAVAQPSCEQITSPCECFARSDCQAVTDSCICECDYACPGKPPCDCACGGGKFLGCKAI